MSFSHSISADQNEKIEKTAKGSGSPTVPVNHFLAADSLRLEKKYSYRYVNDHEIKITKDDEEDGNSKNISVFEMYRFARVWDWVLLAISLLLAIAKGGVLPTYSWVFGNLTQVVSDYVIKNYSSEEFKQEIKKNILYLIYIGAAAVTSSTIQRYIETNRGEVITNRLRKSFVAASFKHNIGVSKSLPQEEFVKILEEDIGNVHRAISGKTNEVFAGMATFICAIIISFVKSWEMTLILSAAGVAIVGDMGFAFKTIGKKTNAYQSSISILKTMVQEALESIHNTIAFNAQNKMMKKMNVCLKNTKDTGESKGKRLSGMIAGLSSSQSLTYGLAFWQGSQYIANDKLTIGSLITIMMSIIVGINSLGNISPGIQIISGAMGSIGKIAQIIDKAPKVMIDEGIVPDRVEGLVQFDHVQFEYPSHSYFPAVKDFNLTISPGQRVALVGPDGAGKTTILSLLEKLYHPTGGIIKLDGIDIAKMSTQWMRKQISIVTRDPTIFTGTIFENIVLGLNGSVYEHAKYETKLRKVIWACKEANAWGFIQGLPEGLDTHICPSSQWLLKDRRYSIAVARAIVCNPKILLFDELEYENKPESEYQPFIVIPQLVDRVSRGRTVITVSRTLETMQVVDKIVFMVKGYSYEIGTLADFERRKEELVQLVSERTVKKVMGGSFCNSRSEISVDEGDCGEIGVKLQREESRNSIQSVSSKIIWELDEDEDKETPEPEEPNSPKPVRTILDLLLWVR